MARDIITEYVKKMESSMSSFCGWRLLREIGNGAYGVVYLAENTCGQRAAVKVCRRDDLPSERYERELRGARLYRTIPRTTGLVRMLELVEEPWGFYSVMELADDEFEEETSDEQYRPKTLASIIGGEKALSLDESVKLGIALAKGLEMLQQHHLMHRDIKPGNVIYVGGSPVLCDPGLVVEEAEAVSLVGTPGYVPPEKFTDAAGDIYSLGLTLKAASFGRHIEDLCKGPAQEADTGAKHFPVWWRILNKATDEDPRRRYQSAKALLKDLIRLRRKMALSTLFGSRVAKAAIVLAVTSAVVVVIYSSVFVRRARSELERISGETKSLEEAASADVRRYEQTLKETFPGFSEERIKDEVLRYKAAGRYSDWGSVEKKAEDRLAIGSWVDIIECKIASINTIINSTNGRGKPECLVEVQAEFEGILDSLKEADAKDALLLKKIIALHSQAKGKVKVGYDDKEEFLQAQKLYEERNELFKGFYYRLKNLSKRISKDIDGIIEAIENDIPAL